MQMQTLFLILQSKLNTPTQVYYRVNISSFVKMHEFQMWAWHGREYINFDPLFNNKIIIRTLTAMKNLLIFDFSKLFLQLQYDICFTKPSPL